MVSDGAANAMQAWEMMHGDPLLHGWYVTDVSFYTTELPQYMLVEAVAGLRPRWCTSAPRSPTRCSSSSRPPWPAGGPAGPRAWSARW